MTKIENIYAIFLFAKTFNFFSFVFNVSEINISRDSKQDNQLIQ